MPPRARLPPPLLYALALGTGALGGALLGRSDASSLVAQAVEGGCEFAGFVVLAGLRALAAPLVLSGLIVGGAGLEAMRRTGQVVGKTFAWMVGSTILAVLTACAVSRLIGDGLPVADFFSRRGLPPPRADPAVWTWGWLALVLAGLGLGYYRNQLEEGQGRLILRFCLSLENMLLPLVNRVRAFSAAGIFFLTVATAARCTVHLQTLPRSDVPSAWAFYERGLIVLLVTAATYVFALSVVVCVAGRLNPWRFARSLAPALLLAGTGQSPEAALPLTLDALRRDAGVSNRVASPVLALCAVLHRDGVALLWTAALLFPGRMGVGPDRWTGTVGTGLFALLLGLGGNTVASRAALLPLLGLNLRGWPGDESFSYVLGWLILTVGEGIGVFSHACAAVLIARSEGEYWVPGPPPGTDELQELKSALESADG